MIGASNGRRTSLWAAGSVVVSPCNIFGRRHIVRLTPSGWSAIIDTFASAVNAAELQQMPVRPPVVPAFLMRRSSQPWRLSSPSAPTGGL